MITRNIKYILPDDFKKHVFELYITLGTVGNVSDRLASEGHLNIRKRPFTSSEITKFSNEWLLDHPGDCKNAIDAELVAQGGQPFSDVEYQRFLMSKCFTLFRENQRRFEVWFSSQSYIRPEYKSLYYEFVNASKLRRGKSSDHAKTS